MVATSTGGEKLPLLSHCAVYFCVWRIPIATKCQLLRSFHLTSNTRCMILEYVTTFGACLRYIQVLTFQVQKRLPISPQYISCQRKQCEDGLKEKQQTARCSDKEKCSDPYQGMNLLISFAKMWNQNSIKCRRMWILLFSHTSHCKLGYQCLTQGLQASKAMQLYKAYQLFIQLAERLTDLSMSCQLLPLQFSLLLSNWTASWNCSSFFIQLQKRTETNWMSFL